MWTTCLERSDNYIREIFVKLITFSTGTWTATEGIFLN